MIELPEKLIQTLLNVYQEKAKLWLAGLAELIDFCEAKWSFQLLKTTYPLSFNYVAPVIYNNGSGAVLKLGVPNKEFSTEIAALQLFNGNGMVRLIDSDADKGILLLEHIMPGETLKSIHNDQQATLIAADVMRKIRIPAPLNSTFATTSQWATGLAKLRARYQGGTGPIPERFVTKAEETYAKLHSTTRNLQLLHGDLHHDNIISAEREPWLAIDPKGVIGEPEYEVISFLMNNLPDLNPIEITRARVDIFVEELGLNKQRVLAWAFSHAVLAASWNIDDNIDGVDKTIETALMFEKLLEEGE